MNIATLERRYAETMPHAVNGVTAEEAKIEPIGRHYIEALGSLFFILLAISVELFSLTLALHTKYEALSSGEDLGGRLISIRYGIGAALLFGHILVHIATGADNSITGWIKRLHVVPIAALVVSMAVFMFLIIAESASDGDGKFGLSGIVLGVGCSVLFTISCLGANWLVGRFLPALWLILSGWAQRSKVAKFRQELKAADDCLAEIRTLQHDLDKDDQPEALRLRTAAEAAAAVEPIAAAAHDAYVERAALEGIELRPDDTFSVSPDSPLEALKQRADFLRGLDTAHFLSILNKKEA